MKRITTLSLVVFCAICLAFAGFTFGQSVNAQEPPTAGSTQTNLPTVFDLLVQYVGDPQTAILHNVYAHANPSVVSITVRIPSDQAQVMSPQSFGQNSPYAYAAGSGFVYDTQNHVVTNTHVIANADQIEVTFADGTMRHATLVGSDPDSDIAVIKVDGDMSAYTPLTVADSEAVKVGDMAIAIGNPFQRSGTMTHGIVSGIHRSVSGLTQSQDGGGYTIPDAIQTDAPINPGNSGGPLLNMQGQVIGVNEQIESNVQQSSGVGFAISSDVVKVAADAIIGKGTLEHSWLGIAGTSLSLDINEALSIDANTKGVYVTAISSNSPAAKAGLLAGERRTQVNGAEFLAGGDVITAINGQAVNNFDTLTAFLFEHTKPGEIVTLTILRNGHQQDIKVTLQARPHTS
ncbi:MAG: trypsin-like peptidase domain-containing protein [Anaerolineae bacterium]|nr:trypsin-like peptidase domain-containing protein [Anaerolineae bacterium]